jgi:predicted amidohydrolase
MEAQLMSSKTVRAAAVQLQAEVGKIDANLEKACCLVDRAIAAGAEYIVLPEFFSSGMTFDDSMLTAPRPLGAAPMQMLKERAMEGGVTIAGSLLAEHNGHVYNTCAVVCPDGEIYTHDKDFPSGPIESAYYAGGEDSVFVGLLRDRGISAEDDAIPGRDGNDRDGVFPLPNISLGAAMCWEMIRHRTIARLRGRVDLVLAGSAWMEIDPDVGFPGMSRNEIVELNKILISMLREAPVRLATLLGVPVIHANLVGPIPSHKLFDQSVDFVSNFAGESQIVTAHGETLARRSGSQGEGIIVADVPLEKCRPPDTQGETFWLRSLPPVLEELWYEKGAIGRQYYLRTAMPHRRARNASS